MAKVVFNMSMSLDGFIAGPNDEVERLFSWYFTGDTEFQLPGTDLVFNISRESAELILEASHTIGAMVTGRRNFDLAKAWGGRPPLGLPHFVVTHTIPQEWVKEGSPFIFVTDGVESAVEKALQAAAGKNVCISSASILQQCLKAGLVDEINIDLVPLLLGNGIRLFEHLGDGPIELKCAQVVKSSGVTHLQFQVKS